MDPLKVCFVASEVAPFAKTGGLADVASALPAYLESQGHDVRVFMPLYQRVDTSKIDFTPVDFLRDINLQLGASTFVFSVLVARAPGSEVDIYFIHCPQLYHGGEIYTGEWDEHLRFALLVRATIECCQRMGWGPDIFHCNDWHTALLPLYLKTIYDWDRLFAHSKTILTIHNIAFQGVFPAEVISNLGLEDYRSLLFQADLEQGAISFMKTGVLYADVVTTVSRTYAREIQTEEYGLGLEALLQQRSATVLGIVNGVDYSEWSPQEDPHIPHNYGIEDVAEGKAKNKRHLLDSVGLSDDPQAPLIGVVSRLTSQKGFELTFEALPEALRYLNLRVVVLGTGESGIEDHFHWLQRTFPQKVCFYRGYNNPLAHLIEAGSDIFLMPSRFEPCGLNQMYSLKYGTVPIVRKTGGLADTVQLFDPATGEGTGFVFDHYDRTGFAWALKTALTT
ncbi:MAG: glycogen synthase, partial [Acidobacteriota bacterium]